MDSDHRAVAVGTLADREYERAGDAYTRAAWDRLAAPRDGLSPFDADGPAVATPGPTGAVSGEPPRIQVVRDAEHLVARKLEISVRF
ncbi:MULTISPECIES: hypothetical protein [Haloarcula]|uniref:hypothetical protein n=1 Tax=Haloarcula TaxID=2237 RepID=UPI0023E83633|nr:hypothetical protein [Halomicroarcula sp. SHR3]